jgi:methyl-accepting chemotaxis protein
MKHKLIITLILLAIVPMAISVVISTWVARDAGWEALIGETEQRLISERENKKGQLKKVFDLFKTQLIITSRSIMTITATKELKMPFGYYHKSNRSGIGIDKMKTNLQAHYQSKFGIEYARQNAGTTIDTNKIINQLSDNTIALQHNYIVANQYPLGEKHKLDRFEDGNFYSTKHKNYHPSYRTFLEEYGYYDIFIVDPKSGHVIYSVFKELDYATSLIDGPYANSGLGEVFRAANKSTDPDSVSIVDFEPYTPSYEAPAAFIASPIFDRKKKVGILIFKLPISKINDITTSNEAWQNVGLGETGETFIIGGDNKTHSESRFFIESPNEYLIAAKANGLDEETANLIVSRGNTAGLQGISPAAFSMATTEVSGFGESVDYRGVPVLSAYAKVGIPGLDWIILSEMTVAEAQLPSNNLSNTLLVSSSVVALILAIVAIGFGWLFSIRLTRPIEKLQHDIQSIEQNSDLATRLTAKPSDVTAEIVESLNQTFEKIHSIVSTVSTNSDQMLQAAENVSRVSASASEGMTRQNMETDSVATAMEQMSATVGEIANNASDANAAASDANKHAQHGNQTVGAATQSINDLADAVKEAAQVINKLASDSESIGKVLDVIRGIAEQTNLLALNAAIEAARAGEQGRGFAVVADEVRTLASRTQESTQEIQSMIETLQNGAANAVKVMDNGEKQAESSVNQAREAAEALLQITGSVAQITEMNRHIAEASEQQRQVSNEVSNSIHSISQESALTAEGSQQMDSESAELANIAKSLKEAVGQFRL